MGSLLDTVGGIPVHPLVVHVVVVLVPLSALGAALMVVNRSFSRRYASLVTVFSAGAAGAAIVAKESGEKLALRVGSPTTHVEFGSLMPFVAAGLFLLITVFWLFDRGIPTNRNRPIWLSALGVVLVLAAAFAMWTFLVGHSGAEAVWTSLLAPKG
jgi:uncharacterized membrane protein